MSARHRVLIMRCEDYCADRIAGIVRDGMAELGAKPTGRILLKPNVVLAHPEVFPHAFTRAEFLDGVISATKALAENPTEIAVGERSAITIPTRANFKMAGYPAVVKKHKIKTYYFDEVRQVPVPVRGEPRLRDQIFVPQPVAKADFLINLPKFKAHSWCRLTLSLKNFIGIQDDRHRLVDHNIFLEHKIADLHAAIQPQFIAIDAITAGHRLVLTPTPYHMGAIVMGTNSCAVDTVGCHMVHVDPRDVMHLRHAAARGLGPIDIGEIDVDGDFALEAVRQRTVDFEICRGRVDEYFGPDAHLSCTVGSFPEKHSPDYCWGGCPGALQEAMHILKMYYPGVDRKMGRIRYVVGKVEGPLQLERDEKVIFAGSCTSWEGEIDGEHVRIDSSYKSHRDVDETKTKSNDMLVKTFRALWHAFRNRSSRWVHLKGCTLSIAEHIHYLSMMGRIGNPNFDRRMMVPVNVAYLQMRFHRFINRLCAWRR
jgi:uncharacterized protein (DUF362 family)